MDYKELVGRLRTISDIFKAHTGMENYIEDAANAITDLLARAEAAEASVSDLRKKLEREEARLKFAELGWEVSSKHAVTSEGQAQEARYRAEKAEARAEKAERERDAAISDLTYIARTYPVDLCDDLVCQYCKHYPNVNTGCPGFTENDCFEWRGQEEE